MEKILLHGAVGCASQMLLLSKLLIGKSKVHTIDFNGHGKKNGDSGGFSIPRFCEDVLNWMEKKRLEKVNIFGYSMGGYVALYLARHHPEKVNSVCTLATKFKWTPEIARQEVRMLDPVKIEEKVPEFAKALAERHSPENWQKVIQKTADMMLKLGESPALTLDDFKSINCRVMVGLGDRDKMVTLDETLEVYKHLPIASLLVMPDTPHPMERVNTELLAHHLHNFFA
jgi:pimeloyl-ACP methyl ester carboxylesterase